MVSLVAHGALVSRPILSKSRGAHQPFRRESFPRGDLACIYADPLIKRLRAQAQFSALMREVGLARP